MSSYYQVLGIGKSASDKDIKAAFRRLARRHHPDLNPGDEAAEREFKKINEAYEVLSDPESRNRYDRYGDNWMHADRIESGGGGFGYGAAAPPGAGDLFGGDLFDLLGGFGRSGARASQRLETSVDISLKEAFTGTTRNVTLSEPHGPRRMEVTIPPGVRSGSKVRISPSEGLDLLIDVKVNPHRLFRRRGDDLHVDAEVPFEVAALGGEAEVPTLKGRSLALRIPAGTQGGRVFRLAGQGMPRAGGGHGDLLARVRLRLPEPLDDGQRALFEQLRASEGEREGATVQVEAAGVEDGRAS